MKKVDGEFKEEKMNRRKKDSIMVMEDLGALCEQVFVDTLSNTAVDLEKNHPFNDTPYKVKGFNYKPLNWLVSTQGHLGYTRVFGDKQTGKIYFEQNK